MTEEGRENRRLRRAELREKKSKKKREEQEGKDLNVATWNVQGMSLGTFNRRKLRAVVDFSRKQGWELVMLTEVRARREGTIWLGEGENLTAVTYSEKAAILMRGRALRSWNDKGQPTKRNKISISVKFMGFSMTSTYQPVYNGKNEEEIDEAKEHLKDHTNWSKKDETLLVGGVFNAHIGRDEDRPGICGIFRLRSTNRQGQDLINWCEDNGLSYRVVQKKVYDVI